MFISTYLLSGKMQIANYAISLHLVTGQINSSSKSQMVTELVKGDGLICRKLSKVQGKLI